MMPPVSERTSSKSSIDRLSAASAARPPLRQYSTTGRNPPAGAGCESTWNSNTPRGILIVPGEVACPEFTCREFNGLADFDQHGSCVLGSECAWSDFDDPAAGVIHQLACGERHSIGSLILV